MNRSQFPFVRLRIRGKAHDPLNLRWTLVRIFTASCWIDICARSELLLLLRKKVLPAMDMSQLLVFDDGRIQNTEEFDASKLNVKELRIKDLHKNLCNRLHTHIGCVSRTTTSVAEPSQPDSERPKKSRRLTESSEIEKGVDRPSVDDFAATQLCVLPSPLDCGQERAPQASLQNKPCLHDDFQRDAKSNKYIHEESFRSCKLDGAKLKFQYSCLPFKSHNVDSRGSRRQLCENAVGSCPVDAPVMQRENDATSDDDAASGEAFGLDSSDDSDLSTHSSSEQGRPLRHPSFFPSPKQSFTIPKRSGVGFDYNECLEDSTDSETCEGGDPIPESKRKSGSRPPRVILEKISPMKLRYACTEASREETVPTVKIGRALDTKMNEKKGRTIRTKLSHDKGKTTNNKSKRSCDPPDPNKGKSGHTLKSRAPIRELKHGYTSEKTSNVVRLDVDTRFKYNPTFAVEMIHSSVTTGFWLRYPAEFACKHMPNQDEVVVLEDAHGLKWDTNYLAKKKSLSAGWRRFARDHGLELGHVLVFELMKPLQFLVNIVEEPLSQLQRKWPKV